MLTTTAILMSFGTDPVKVPHVSSDQINPGSMSFAESFDEGSALAGKMQVQSANDERLKTALAVETVDPAKSLGIAAAVVGANVAAGKKSNADVSAGSNAPDQVENIKDLNPAPVVKVPGTTLNGANKAPIVGGVLVQAGRSIEMPSTPVQTEVPKGQLSSTALTQPIQNFSSEGIDVAGQDTSDVAEALTILPISDNGEKPVVSNRKTIQFSEKSQETVPEKKIAKNHDDGGKIKKAIKTEKPIGTIAGAVGVQPQAVAMAAVVVTAHINGQQLQMSAAAENGSVLGLVPPTSERTAAVTALENNKTDKRSKESTSTGKTEGVDARAAVSPSVDDSDSRKSEADAAKTATPVGPTDGGVARGQSAAKVIATTGPLHAESAPPGVVPEGIATAATAHAIGSGSPTVATTSHAATLPSGSSAVDAPAPVEETHKTLTATPTTLEVGIANGTHGWLKIRAEISSGGAVNASLSTASSSGQEMLHRELPALTAYLQNERVAVNTVVVQPAAAAAGDFRGLTGGMNGNSGGQAQHGEGQRGENRQDAMNAVLNMAEHDVPYNGLSGIGRDELLPRLSYASGGSWLSVRA